MPKGYKPIPGVDENPRNWDEDRRRKCPIGRALEYSFTTVNRVQYVAENLPTAYSTQRKPDYEKPGKS